MKQQEELLEELEGNAADYRSQGKADAAARLEQQTQLLRVRQAELATNHTLTRCMTFYLSQGLWQDLISCINKINLKIKSFNQQLMAI